MAPFYGRGSTVSWLQSHCEETFYHPVPRRSKGIQVPSIVLMLSDQHDFDLTLKSSRIVVNFEFCVQYN